MFGVEALKGPNLKPSIGMIAGQKLEPITLDRRVLSCEHIVSATEESIRPKGRQNRFGNRFHHVSYVLSGAQSPHLGIVSFT